MQGLFVLMRSALKYLGGSISKDVSPIRSVEKALRGTAKSLGPKIGGDIDVHTSKDAGKFAPMYFFYFSLILRTFPVLVLVPVPGILILFPLVGRQKKSAKLADHPITEKS